MKISAASLGIKYRSTNRFRGVTWDITQNIKGTDNQRNDVITIGLEQSVSSFFRVLVSPLKLVDIIKAKQGIMIVIIRSESL